MALEKTELKRIKLGFPQESWKTEFNDGKLGRKNRKNPVKLGKLARNSVGRPK